MRYYFNILFAFTVLATLSLTSCSEPDYPTPNVEAQNNTFTARALFVNAAPGAPGLNLSINNIQVGNTVNYSGQSPYRSFPLIANNNLSSGNTQIRAKAASGQIGGTLGSSDLLFRAGANNQNNFNAANGRSYTVFVTDTLARPKPTTPAGATDPGGLRFLVVEDNLAAPSAGNAHVRFFHLAPGAPAVWITVAGGPMLFANRAYRETSTGSGTSAVNFVSFTPVAAGTYTLEVRTTSATGPIVLTVPNVTLVNGKIYTIYAQGRVGSSATPLSAGVIVHN